ncbi:hypothetical protein BMS3Bbin16_00452 [archaeon BMS3Bbin16]|nr:hypothetical protein BMS3Bbin16_00452 [archaeon BMS3Bbin16]
MNSEQLLERDVKKEIEWIFEDKKTKLNIDVNLEIIFIEHPTIEGSFVYGEAFPFEKPPRVRLEVVAIDATYEELNMVISDELIHIKHPEIEQYVPDTLEEREEFIEKMKAYL